MVFGLPARDEANWDTKLNESINAVKATADAAKAEQDSGRLTDAALTATYAKVVAATTLTGAGIEDAAASVGPGGSVFLLPGETYEITAPITLSRVGLVGDGSPVINVATSLGTGVAAVTITSPTEGYNNIPVRGFSLIGPGPRSLGVKTADCDGIEITGYAKPIFEDMQVKQFDSGFVLNNTVGHIYFVRVSASDNYYGVYCQLNNNDYVFDQCLINGNTFANFACPADQGFGALVVQNSHIGYAPYGIYQEATPAAQGSNKVFLQTATFRDARFEQIGNAAIWTDATQDASNFSLAGTILIEHPGFSWGAEATYRIADRPKTHSVQFSQTDRIIQIIDGSYPFLSGDGGTSAPIRVKQAVHAAFEIRGTDAATSNVQVDAGTPRVFAYAQPVAGVVTTNGDAANATVNVGTSSGYVVPGGDPARRYGADAAYLYADFNEWRFRNSGADYALIGRIQADKIIMPQYSLGAAGATGGPLWKSGTGTPEGVVTAPVGSLFSRTDGGAATSLYVKESGTGNTGWVAK